MKQIWNSITSWHLHNSYLDHFLLCRCHKKNKMFSDSIFLCLEGTGFFFKMPAELYFALSYFSQSHFIESFYSHFIESFYSHFISSLYHGLYLWFYLGHSILVILLWSFYLGHFTLVNLSLLFMQSFSSNFMKVILW